MKLTVIDYNGEALGRHLTEADAAHTILTHDGADYEIREGEWKGSKIFELWTRKQVANKPWTETAVFSMADTRAEAEAEIFAEVCAARWPRHPEAISDDQYDEILAVTADTQGD
jgi:hypothetical protein